MKKLLIINVQLIKSKGVNILNKYELHEVLTEMVEDEEIKHGEKILVELWGRNICEVEVERDDDCIDFKIKKIY